MGILDIDQATAINAKLDAMQHNRSNFHGVGTKTKITRKGMTNTTLKGLGNNTKILTKAQILAHPKG